MLKYLHSFDDHKVKYLYNYKFLKIKVFFRIAMMAKIKLINVANLIANNNSEQTKS